MELRAGVGGTLTASSFSLHSTACCHLQLVTFLRVSALLDPQNIGVLEFQWMSSLISECLNLHEAQKSCCQLLALLTLPCTSRQAPPTPARLRCSPLPQHPPYQMESLALCFCVPGRLGASLVQTRGLVHAG